MPPPKNLGLFKSSTKIGFRIPIKREVRDVILLITEVILYISVFNDPVVNFWAPAQIKNPTLQTT